MRVKKAILLLSAFLLALAFVMAPAMVSAQSSTGSGWPDTAVVALTPNQEPNLTTPISAGQSPQGVAVVQMNDSSSQMCYQLWVSGISNVTQAHFHMGAPGAEGPVVAWLYPANKSDQASVDPNTSKLPGNFTGLLAMGNISAADLVGPMQGKNLTDLMSAMMAGQLYVNVHTTQNPGGEIRGQITDTSIWTTSTAVAMTPLDEPRLNTTDPRWNISGMMASNASMSLASLQGRNLGEIPWGVAVVQPNGTNIHYAIWAFNIANVTQAHFHMGLRGVEGPVVAWLYPSSSSTSPANITPAEAGRLMSGKLVEGNVSAENLIGPMQGMTTNDLLGAMGNGSIYVNVHTTQNPGGEIRGQIDPANMTCGAAATPTPSAAPSSTPEPQMPSPPGYAIPA